MNGAPWDGAACPHLPPVRMYGVVWSRGWGVIPLVHAFHANGKGGDGGHVPFHAPFLRIQGRAVEVEVPGAMCPLCAPLLRKWEESRQGSRALASLSPTCTGWRGREVLGRHTPSTRWEGWGLGSCALARPAPVRTQQCGRRGKGRCSVPSCALLPCKWEGRGQGEREGGGGCLVRIPSVRMGRRGGGQCRIGGRGGEGLTFGHPIRVPFVLMRRKGLGRGGEGCPVRSGQWSVQGGVREEEEDLCTLFLHSSGGSGQCGGREGGDLPCLHVIRVACRGWGHGPSSFANGEGGDGRATGMEGGDTYTATRQHGGAGTIHPIV
ncbi:hypothetical protein EDB86DRAFT_2830638 [Lactarius hatsudake]|nr:hypothetical protein EDB86DRAFT_2830638 [Lactarius hatsudake]